jgi:hypothetical protein
MSTLKTNTLSNVAGTASTAIENAINGSAKAWVNFNGTGTVAIRASFNVTSITDNGTGDYTVNFTTAFADANYNFVGTCYSITTAPTRGFVSNQSTANFTPTTSALRIGCIPVGGGSQDYDVVNVSVFR